MTPSQVAAPLRKVLSFVLIATFCFTLPTMAQQTQPHPLPAARYIPSYDFDTQNIKLNLHFDFEKEWAIGTATITFAPMVKNLRSIELDAGDMTINSVKLIS